MNFWRLALVVIMAGCLKAEAEVPNAIQLEVSAETTANIRTGERGVIVYLAPVGPLEARVRAGRVTLSHALDDTEAVLTQTTTNKFYSVSVGRVDDSKDLTSSEPTPFSLWGLSESAKALEMISGTLELVVPDLDPNATVVVDNIASAFGSAIKSEALAKAGVTLVVFDKKSAEAEAATKAPGGPQEFDAGPIFGASYHPPPGFPKPGMEAGDIAVAIDDPGEHLIGVEIQAADGSPLHYNHGGHYHSSGLVGSPGRRFDIYGLGAILPEGARLICWLVTPGSCLKIPFHIDTLPLPGAGGRRHLGLMTVRMEGAINRTKEALEYQEAHSESRVESTAPQVVDKIALLWSDVPEYVAILKRNLHYKKLPKLVSAVAPEQQGPMPPPTVTVNVLVSFAVDDHGNVEAARVVESNDARYNMRAVETVLRWRFQPAEVENGPAMAFITVPFVFKPPTPAPVSLVAPPSS